MSLVQHMAQRSAAAALAELDAAIQQGVEVGPLIEQLFGCFRDLLLAAVGCPEEMFSNTSPANWPALSEAGKRLGVETILAAMQILDHTMARLRFSTQGRILAELAVVRISNLENLADLPELIAQIQGDLSAQAPDVPSGPAGSDEGPKKKNVKPQGLPGQHP